MKNFSFTKINWRNKPISILILIIIIVYGIFNNIILYNLTYFDKNITIKNKYTRFRRNSSSNFYMVVDNENNIYSVDNLWWKGDFNRANDWNILKNGMEYRVKGYGIRFAMLDWYPIIVSVSKT